MTKVKLTNAVDVVKAVEGLLRPEEVRRIEVEALVDTGATLLAVPADVAAKLGLTERGRRRVRYADGRVADVPWVGPVTVEILGREMHCDAMVEAVGTTPLVGQIPLEALDLVVDPRTRDVTVNPASPDMPLLDMLGAGCRVGPPSDQTRARSEFGQMLTRLASAVVRPKGGPPV